MLTGANRALALFDETRGKTTSSLPPGKRNAKYVRARPLTDEAVASHYNNFYEFTTDKQGVAALAARFTTYPWTMEVASPKIYDLDGLPRRFALEVGHGAQILAGKVRQERAGEH